MSSENVLPDQKKAKRFVIIWTCLFGFLFPFVFWMSLWSIFIFDNPRATAYTGIPIICAFLCVPLSMLVSIWKMWSHYLHKRYSDVYWFCSLPFLMVLFAILFTSVVEGLFLRP
jgi:hypothetical protein